MSQPISKSQWKNVPFHLDRSGPIRWLLVVVALFVVMAWTAFLCLFWTNCNDSVLGLAVITLASVGAFELGIVVLISQMIWLLPSDDPDGRAMPFLSIYILIAQSLLLMPMTLLISIWLVPLAIGALVSIGWYFQKFACIKIVHDSEVVTQTPLSLLATVSLPFWFVCLGGCGTFPLLLFDMNWMDGRVFVLVSAAIAATCIIPLAITYGLLAYYRIYRTFSGPLILWCLGIILSCSAFEYLQFSARRWYEVLTLSSLFFLLSQSWMIASLQRAGVSIRRVPIQLMDQKRKEVLFEEIH